MRFSRTIAAIAICAASCLGAQEGKFANSGNRETAVLPGVGLILIARGAALRDSAVVGGEENLLYVLVVCPGIEGGSTGGGSNIGRFTSEYWGKWSTSAGEISLAYSWNRVTDTVHIAGREFDRGHGNAFVVRRDPATSAWSAHQLSNIAPQLSPPDALHQIQRSFPMIPLYVMICDDEAIRRNERSASAGVETDAGFLEMFKPLRRRLELVFFSKLFQWRRVEEPHAFIS